MRNTRPIPLAPAVVNLLGLLFCLWVLFTGGKALCASIVCWYAAMFYGIERGIRSS